MPVDWREMQEVMHPIKDYAALRQRWQEAFGYSFVRQAYNFTLPEIADYTRRLLGEDTRNRYQEYSQGLVKTFHQLHQVGVRDLMELVAQVDTRAQFETFADQAGVQGREAMAVLKYLVYWVIPSKKYLSGLVVKGSPLLDAVRALGGLGIRTNLAVLQQGLTPADRRAIAAASGLGEAQVSELVNRADFSRLPWASKATISNIMGAGYGSIVQLANADLEQLEQDFYRYGASIGKNLKFGNEIESSYRIAKIVPPVLKE